MILPFRLRAAYLNLQLRQVSRRQQALIAALVVLEEQQVRKRRRERTVWVKPWLLRQLLALGHFDTLMQELMRESRGYFKSYFRSEPLIFRETVNRLTLSISNYL